MESVETIIEPAPVVEAEDTTSLMAKIEAEVGLEAKEEKETLIKRVKALRVICDGALTAVTNHSNTEEDFSFVHVGSQESQMARTKLIEAIMWLGMDLKRLGAVNPYPNSRNPENAIVDPTADNLKMQY